MVDGLRGNFRYGDLKYSQSGWNVDAQGEHDMGAQ